MADSTDFDSPPFEPGLSYAELTDIGMRRTNNQDALVSVPAGSRQTFAQRGHLFVVADGMGAHAAGELASRMATSQIVQHYTRLAEQHPVPEALHQSMLRANADIFARGQSNPDFLNMGTTACALAISPLGATIAHVGDSRVYRLRNRSLEQLTFDHSLVWELEAGGQISAAGAANIPKNVITRSLGPHAEVSVDIEGPIDVQTGDQFLLCSDGLTGPVTDEEIAVLMHCLDEQAASRVLIDLANLRGGPDNISVIVVKIDELAADIAASKPTLSPDPAVRTTLWVVAGVAVLAAITLAVSGMTGPMVIALVLAAVSAAASLLLPGQFGGTESSETPEPGGGNAPYRRYPVRPTGAMVHALGQTINQLCSAAQGRGWSLDQSRINELLQACRLEVDQSRWQAAIEYQAEAITETMNQLRRQNDTAAADHSIR